MVVGWKESFKLIGIVIVCACAVMVCTFFLNYYLDASALRDTVDAESFPLYEAQILTAKIVSLISGGCLSLIAALLVVFYVKLYVDAHARQLGVLKAIGYSDMRIAAGFWVFGLAAFIGCLAGFGGGFALMPLIYEKMSEGLFDTPISFHAELLFGLVFAPAVFFGALAIVCARLKMRVSAMTLLRGEDGDARISARAADKDRPFLTQLRRATLMSKKSLMFFIGFGAFCYSTMLQMALTMDEYASAVMGIIIFLIGAVLSVTCLLLAVTVLARANRKTVAVMRAYGYTFWECGRAVFGGYTVPALVGYGIGTVYEYGLMRFMLDIIFRDVSYEVPAYTFQTVDFFCVLASFLIFYGIVLVLFTHRLGKTSVRAFVLE